MSYYINEEFNLLKKYNGQHGSKDHPAYEPLKTVYQKTEDICNSIVDNCFPGIGKVNIRKVPTNQEKV